MLKNFSPTKFAIVLGSLFSLQACATVSITENPVLGVDPNTLEKAFKNSVKDAKNVEIWEVSDQLSKVTVDNPDLQWKFVEGDKYIRVASWKAKTDYYKPKPGSIFYNTGDYPIWITLAPQLQDMCREKGFDEGVGQDTRLEQLLGLKPNSNYKAFVEFWVKPRDLFRPCPNPDITDESCGLDFPPHVSAQHRKWIQNERLTNDYPWTQLGYTYDWNRRTGNHVGLSEFVIKRDADVIIAGIYKTADYCRRS